MNTARYRGLLALNGGLIITLALVTLGSGTPGAHARQAQARPHGQYTMVTARMQGQTEAAIVLLDSANQEMVALRWDRNRKVLSPLGYRNLEQDTQLRQRQGR